MTDIKAWIDERQACLAHVQKHPHPDPAATWAQQALTAIQAVLEQIEFMGTDAENYLNAGHLHASEALLESAGDLRQAIEGAINHE